MRVVVLDASVAVKWYVREEGRELALQLLKRDDLTFIAPDVFLPEVVNALLRQNRAKHFQDTFLDAALRDLRATLPELMRSSNVMDRAVPIARSLGHPIYDCLYLALAERWDTIFVTADIAFIKLCRSRLADDPITGRLRDLTTDRIT